MEKGKKMQWYIGSEWKMEHKGLRKQVLDINFKQLEKPHLVAKVLIIIENVQNLNTRASKYLAGEQLGQEQQLEMGSALTPIDCYVELLVRQMIVGERARCYIAIKPTATCSDAAREISFVATLQQIIETKETHKLIVPEMYSLALRYKDNGVTMFKAYPLFAHDYFARAAKCLISYKPFTTLSLSNDGVAGEDMQTLFTQIQTNLAACLLNQQRYEDVIYQTQSVDAEPTLSSEKATYRRAMAFFHIKEFDKAQTTIQRVPNYHEKKDFAKLQQRIAESWKSSNDEYKNVVQRMFN